MVSVVATRYAKALADVVVGQNNLDAGQVLAQLRSVQSLIEGSADLRNALAEAGLDVVGIEAELPVKLRTT